MNFNREIMRLSVPAILSNITVPLLGLCDTAISGHLGSALFLGAISVGSMMLNVLFWLLGFLRMGTSGLAAQAYGSGSAAAQRDVLTRSVALAMLLGIALILFQSPIYRLMSFLISPQPEVESLASLYFSICIWEAPALLSIMAFSGWFIGMQTTVCPMAIAISVNVINICLSFLLVFVFRVGFAGVAIGTLCANWLGLVVAVVLARRHVKGQPLFSPLKSALKGTEMRKFFSVNSDLFMRSACIMSVTLAVTAIGARLGSLTLAANAVAMQFFHFFSFFMDGFAFTGEALVGRFCGSRQSMMLSKAVRYTLLWSAAVAVAFFVIYLVAWRGVTDILTDLQDVRAAVADLRWWIVAIPPVTVAAFVFDGFFIGATATRKMLLATFIASGAFFLIAYADFSGGELCFSLPSNHRLWLSFLIYLGARGGILAAIWPRQRQQLNIENKMA